MLPVNDYKDLASCSPGLSCLTSGIDNSSSTNYISVFPNPSRTVFQFNIINEIERIEVRNSIGEVILFSNKNEIDLSNYADGFYFYQLLTKDLKIISGILMKN